MKKHLFSTTTCLLITLLFVYAAVSKLIDFERFKAEMHNQVFTKTMTNLLIWTLPLMELLTSLFLAFEKTRLFGMMVAAVLMACFTMYTGAVILHFFPRVPCSCGGIFNTMGWTAHFIINLCCLGLLIVVLWLEILKKEHLKKRYLNAFMHKKA